ncbi:MAG: NTP transferase domain-containing protein [Rhodocyclales bacterium]|nr:NTP transferase domain-containing protein [Rhodocyclales bacterium]
MIFGRFALADALGVMLAHTLKVDGRSFRKGHVLDSADLTMLREAGVTEVSGARLAPDDVPENDAAAEIAALLGGINTTTRAPYAGRSNVHAVPRGVVEVDAECIDRLNLLDEAIAIGTLPPYALARAGQVLATVKIIPCAVPRRLLDACRAIVASSRPLRLAELRPHRVALIMSALPGMSDKQVTSALGATRARVEALGSRLALVLRCAHERDAIADVLRQTLAAGCDLVLINGASMTKDRLDTVPAAISAAGGEIVHFGMPVEPGNMLLLGRVGSVAVVGLPGCARSRRSNGLDWLLHRLLAHLPVTREHIMRMGVGGLIRSPLESEDDSDDGGDAELTVAPPDAPHVAVLILAAGTSSRMGETNKLLAEVDGVPMVLRALNAAQASRAASVTVVLGHEGTVVEALLAPRPARVVHNPDFAQGLSTSLRCGIAALPADARAVLVMLADMPRVSAAHLDRLIEAWDPARPAIIVPHHDGRRGNPVLWPRALFSEMQAVGGDRGARELLARHADQVRRVEFDDDAIFIDVDTPADLARHAAPPPGGDG